MNIKVLRTTDWLENVGQPFQDGSLVKKLFQFCSHYCCIPDGFGFSLPISTVTSCISSSGTACTLDTISTAGNLHLLSRSSIRYPSVSSIHVCL